MSDGTTPDAPRPVRRDGFGYPVHPFQMASWVVYFGVIGSFYSLFLIPLDDSGRTIAGIVYGVFATLTMIGAVVATRTDPSDPLLAKAASSSEEATLSWCYRCEKHVHPSSKHCTMCNKCVDVFDHHCIWLNNCVGRQNIVAFYTVLVGAACMLGTQIVVGCFDIVGFANGSWGSRQGAMYPSVSPLGTFIPMLAVWVLCIAVVALVAQLFSFHALLVLRNITTFDYIVQRGQARNGQEVTPGHGSSLGTWFAGYQRPGGAKVGGVEGGRAAHAAALAAGVPTVPTVEASLTVRDINITVGGVGATRQAPPAPAAAAPEEVDAYSSEPGDVFNRPVRI